MREPLIAILCSGQGRQHRGMFDLTAQAAAAQAIFDIAAPYFGGTDPRDFVRNASPDMLFGNRVGQLLCCTQALAAWAALGDARPARAVMAGYSVGELAAWGCAGMLAPAAVLALAAQRAQAMDAAAAPGAGLLAVTGLREAALRPMMPDGAAWIAIVNDDDHFVIGGQDAALRAIAAQAAEAGARHVVRLPIAVPSHTPMLQTAAARFAETLATFEVRLPTPGVQVLSGIDSDPVRDIAAGREMLSRQIGATIHWSRCLQRSVETGAVTALELGPGDALSRMAQTREGLRDARALDQFHHLDGARAWLRAIRAPSAR
jgi:[acyl-carrier-protein] S-malonyltransferase